MKNSRVLALGILAIVGVCVSILLGMERTKARAQGAVTSLASVGACYSGTASATNPSSWVAGISGEHIYLTSVTISVSSAGNVGIWDKPAGTAVLIWSGNLAANTVVSIPRDWFFASSGPSYPSGTTTGPLGASPNGYELGSGDALEVSGSAGSVYGTAGGTQQ